MFGRLLARRGRRFLSGTSIVVLALAAVGCSSSDSVSALVAPLDCKTNGSAIANPDATPSSTALKLVDPTGPHAVGTTEVALTDSSRPDSLADTPGPVQILSQIFYPTDKAKATGCGTTRYQDADAAKANEANFQYPAGSLGNIRTPALLNAPIEKSSAKYPVVLYTHGLIGSLTDNTNAAMQLASNGYVVVAYAVSNESPSVRFPDGHIVTSSQKATKLIQSDDVTPLIQRRTDDGEFVLKQLSSGSSFPSAITSAVDTTKVAMFGHSAGGAASLQVAKETPNVLAAVNLDGFTRQNKADEGLNKPFVFVTSEGHGTPAQEPSWGPFLNASSNGQIVGMGRIGHLSLTDEGTKGWIEAQNLKSVVPPQAFAINFGEPYDDSQSDISQGLLSFFDKTLKGKQTATGFSQIHATNPDVVKSVVPVDAK